MQAFDREEEDYGRLEGKTVVNMLKNGEEGKEDCVRGEGGLC